MHSLLRISQFFGWIEKTDKNKTVSQLPKRAVQGINIQAQNIPPMHSLPESNNLAERFA